MSGVLSSEAYLCQGTIVKSSEIWAARVPRLNTCCYARGCTDRWVVPTQKYAERTASPSRAPSITSSENLRMEFSPMSGPQYYVFFAESALQLSLSSVGWPAAGEGTRACNSGPLFWGWEDQPPSRICCSICQYCLIRKVQQKITVSRWAFLQLLQVV